VGSRVYSLRHVLHVVLRINRHDNLQHNLLNNLLLNPVNNHRHIRQHSLPKCPLDSRHHYRRHSLRTNHPANRRGTINLTISSPSPFSHIVSYHFSRVIHIPFHSHEHPLFINHISSFYILHLIVCSLRSSLAFFFLSLLLP
jgi:hypothetical protein